jgi:hypothetical protein
MNNKQTLSKLTIIRNSKDATQEGASLQDSATSGFEGAIGVQPLNMDHTQRQLEEKHVRLSKPLEIQVMQPSKFKQDLLNALERRKMERQKRNMTVINGNEPPTFKESLLAIVRLLKSHDYEVPDGSRDGNEPECEQKKHGNGESAPGNDQAMVVGDHGKTSDGEA